jgi:hypothetical protein
VAQPATFLKLRRPLVQDGALAVLLAVLAFMPGLSDAGTQVGDLPTRPADALSVILTLATALPLVIRRRWPGACLAVVGTAWAVTQAAAYPPSLAGTALLVALYTAGAHLRRRWRPALAVAVGAYVVLALVLHGRGSPDTVFDFVAFGLLVGACAAIGAGVTTFGDQQKVQRELAVVNERARIARDLHDVITHHVTAMVVQADAAQFQTDSADVTTSLSNVSDTGRRALGELRQMLDVLSASSPAADRTPAVGRIADLVEQVRASGQPVELVESGSPGLLAGGAELAAYRVVQEGLTNAMKHAAGQPTVVRIAYSDQQTEISVTTDGPVVPPSGGHGLTGLRERVAVFGGSLESGPRAEGGFRVRARIPAGGAA